MEDIRNDMELFPTRKKKPGLVLGIVLLVIALALGAVVFVLYNSRNLSEQERLEIINSGVFHDGITVSGVAIGGMTMAQATEALSVVENQMLTEISYTLTYQDKSYSLDATDFTVEFNTQSILNEALLLARDGSLEQLKTELAEIKSNGRSYDISYEVTDASRVKDKLDVIASEIDAEPVNASMAMLAAEPSPSGGEAIASATDLSAQHFTYTESKDGIKVDTSMLFDTIDYMSASKEFGEIEIPVDNVPAEISTDMLKGKLVMRSHFSTFYGKSPYNRDTRVFNMNKAAGLINGTILAPGDVFSTNTILGNRTYASGWKPAPAVIMGGADTEDQAGGGVCQVSTTVYVAVLQADLEIVYRQAHSSKLSYVPGGLDATIDSGHIDFKWKNNTTSDIYVFTWLDTASETVNCAIYGEPFPETFDSITAHSEKIESLSPGPDEYYTDATLPYGSISLTNAKKSGSVWQSYVTYYKGETEVETKKVALTTYKAHPNRYAVGPGYGTTTPNPYYVPTTTDSGFTSSFSGGF